MSISTPSCLTKIFSSLLHQFSLYWITFSVQKCSSLHHLLSYSFTRWRSKTPLSCLNWFPPIPILWVKPTLSSFCLYYSINSTFSKVSHYLDVAKFSDQFLFPPLLDWSVILSTVMMSSSLLYSLYLGFRTPYSLVFMPTSLTIL